MPLNFRPTGPPYWRWVTARTHKGKIYPLPGPGRDHKLPWKRMTKAFAQHSQRLIMLDVRKSIEGVWCWRVFRFAPVKNRKRMLKAIQGNKRYLREVGLNRGRATSPKQLRLQLQKALQEISA